MRPELRLRRRVLGALAAACALPRFAIGRSGGGLDQAVEQAFRPLLAAHDVDGMAVALTFAGERHQFAYGNASRQERTPVTRDTLFEIGSLSKTFTATLAAWAQERGKLSLADAPGRHVPALRGSALDRATLLHLGTYTAGGLPLQFPDDVTSLDAAIDYYRAFRPSAAPGAVRRYSNPSIGLLGHATAAAMGRDFVELCEAELFPRLGLAQTFLRMPPAALPRYAWGVNKAGQPTRMTSGVFDAQAYGVRSTAADLLRFLEVNLQPTALEPALARAVQATHRGHFEVAGMVQGLGWEQHPWPLPLARLLAGNSSTLALEPHSARVLPSSAGPTHRLFNKTGSTNGFGAYAAFVPSRRLGLVLLANRNIPIPARITAAHAVLAFLDTRG